MIREWLLTKNRTGRGRAEQVYDGQEIDRVHRGITENVYLRNESIGKGRAEKRPGR